MAPSFLLLLLGPLYNTGKYAWGIFPLLLNRKPLGMLAGYELGLVRFLDLNPVAPPPLLICASPGRGDHVVPRAP